MEYLPNGDLHKHLTSPLPEEAGQRIIFQILEGLQIMHNKGFAHRDLKPANILVVHEGPDWWVKIADFGISKRATEGLTALRTQTGTPAFAAPEVIGFVQPGDESDDSYTHAVDIWSLSVITFLVLTGETLFKDQRRLGQYIAGNFKFPSEVLLANKVSGQGCDFIKSLMAPKSKDRPGAKECLQHPWLDRLVESPKTQRKINLSWPDSISLDDSDHEPSASWSTRDQISAHKTHSSTSELAESATHVSSKAIALPLQEAENSTSELAETIALPIFRLANVLRGHLSAVLTLVFSPDGKQIASGAIDKTVRLWDSATGTACGTFQGYSDWVTAVVFSPDGKQIASASGDRTARLWDSATGVARGTLQGLWDYVTAVIFSPDGKQIASGSIDKTVRLWDSATGVARGTLHGYPDYVTAIVFSPDGKQIAFISEDLTVRLWDSATGSAYKELQYSGDFYAVVYSPDGKQIAASSGDGTIGLWNLSTEAAGGEQGESYI